MKTSEKLAALMAILRGKPDLAQQILADTEGVQKAAEAAGLETKEVTEMFAVPDEPAQEEVIPTPPVDKQAAEPPADPEPDEIGDMTRQELADFCAAIVKQMMGKKEEEVALKQAGTDQLLVEVGVTLKTLGEQVTGLDHTMKETQQSLLELTDARPVGIKQLQTKRPTERSDNIIATAPTGPHMDDSFVKFLQGGK